MCNNLLVLEFTEIPCSDANLIDIPTVLQKLVFHFTGWASKCCLSLFIEACVEALLFTHGYSCCLGCPEW